MTDKHTPGPWIAKDNREMNLFCRTKYRIKRFWREVMFRWYGYRWVGDASIDDIGLATKQGRGPLRVGPPKATKNMYGVYFVGRIKVD